MELSFIVACLAHQLDPHRPLPDTPPELDWNRLHRLLVRHRLAELFCILGEANPGLLPPELQQAIRRQRFTALFYGDPCVSQVRTVLKAMRQADLPVIVLKGWALIPTVYGGDYGQRPCADIDLLVLPRDAVQADGILRDLGYTGCIEFWPGYMRRYGMTRSYVQTHNTSSFGHVFGVDLHVGLLSRPFFDHRVPVGGLFQRSEPLQVAGVEACSLAAEDDLVYSCGHLALHHGYDEALSRCYEMASVILRAGPAFDWNSVAERATAWRMTLPVQRVLARLEALWPDLIPVQAPEAIASLQATLTERYMHDWASAKKAAGAQLLDGLSLPGLGNRVRYFLETAFPGPSFMRHHYGTAPGGLWPLLYLRRAAATSRHLLRHLTG